MRALLRPPLYLVLLGILVLSLMRWSTKPAAADVPLPHQLQPTGNCWNDNISYGEIPPGSAAHPVLVFVHGLGGTPADWWTTPNRQSDIQDMWQVVYNAGYRSAYVNLGVSTDEFATVNCNEPALQQNSWADDSYILAEQIATIATYYGVPTVDVVAHSKGGVDTQAAIVNIAGRSPNAAAQIRNVFFLGSPHQGSLVADAGCPITVKVGLPDPATCSLQTQVMQQQFRPVADKSPLNANVHYYLGIGNLCNAGNTTACSADTRQFGDTLPGGASMLAVASGPPLFGGPNDNIITVSEMQLAYALPLFVQPWSHYQETVGHNAFPYIQQILASQGTQVDLPLVFSTGAGSGRPTPTPLPTNTPIATNTVVIPTNLPTMTASSTSTNTAAPSQTTIATQTTTATRTRPTRTATPTASGAVTATGTAGMRSATPTASRSVMAQATAASQP